ncbi:hypothetical protein [Nocardiopsis sp. FR26]|uniref:hypothetical protein n=1 Tax=Nocardiopsis sp. FR26 TaxID=2605987 RepID=UPI00135B0016|nr:hypothetical protein [Nocardiopsis sp. FR26]
MTEDDLRDAPPEDCGTGQGMKDDRAAVLLRKHPGKWLRVRVCATRQRAQSAAHRVRSGGMKAFRRGFHAEAITTKTGEHQVWATYRPGLADGPKRELL